MTTITLSNNYGSYTVSVPENDLTVDEVVDIFKSVLLAATYQPESVKDACESLCDSEEEDPLIRI